MLEKNGFCVFSSVLNAEEHSRLTEYTKMLMRLLLIRHGDSGNYGHKLYRSDNLLANFPCIGVYEISDILATIESSLGDEFEVSQCFLHFSMPNNKIQHLHVDAESSMDLVGHNAPLLLAAHIPICRFDSETGGMRIIAGSHLSKDRAPEPNMETVEYQESVVVLEIGDVLLRDCRAWHGATVNSSIAPRPMISIAFAAKGQLPESPIGPDVYFSLPKRWRKHFRLSHFI